jgi:hypothetical protein
LLRRLCLLAMTILARHCERSEAIQRHSKDSGHNQDC